MWLIFILVSLTIVVSVFTAVVSIFMGGRCLSLEGDEVGSRIYIVVGLSGNWGVIEIIHSGGTSIIDG